MDPSQIKKIQAMNRYKRRQFLNNLYFYSLTALTCSLFCCVTLCLPHLSSLLRLFFLAHISSLIAVLLSSKLLFIIGNLIIFFLVVNSRILSSNSPSNTCNNVYYDEYIQTSQTSMPHIVTLEVKTFDEKHVVDNFDMTRKEGVKNLYLKGTKTWKTNKEKENKVFEGDGKKLVSSYDELNKRADDFIARVNAQRKLELTLLQCGSY